MTDPRWRLPAPFAAPPVATPPARPERVSVEPPPDSRLEALLTLYPHMKAQADAAGAKLEDLRKGIDEELSRYGRPSRAYEIPAHPRGLYPAFIRYWTSVRRLDSKRLKDELPSVWNDYCTEGGHWTLKKS